MVDPRVDDGDLDAGAGVGRAADLGPGRGGVDERQVGMVERGRAVEALVLDARWPAGRSRSVASEVPLSLTPTALREMSH